ncbi:hypothetical protein BPAE_0148g00110 [Botrytis paeoniae]|uniref:Uncharacterized protein n=1 Tax=Botrytis paeoniae TaxID=278948 RepID=A0A4Z1FN51_9HELO|nr:hypothetical protein BPAE_0148g00110 [Botrytis paeoniae]
MAEDNVYDPDLDQDLEFYEGSDPAEHVEMPANIEAPHDPLAFHSVGLPRRRKRWLDTAWTWNEPLNPMYEGNMVVKQRPRLYHNLKDPMGQKLSDESKHYGNPQSLLPLNPQNIYIKKFPHPTHSRDRGYVPGSFRRAAKIKIPQDEEDHRKHCNSGTVDPRAPEQLRALDMRDTRPWLQTGFPPPDLAVAPPAAQPEPAPPAPLAPRQAPLPAAPLEQIRPPAAPRVAPVIMNPELDLDAGPPEPRLGPPPSPPQPPHDPPALNQQAAEPAPPQQDPPDRPNVIRAEIPDPRAVVYAEADEHLPAYQLEVPKGEVMPQPEWGEGLERPAPNYPEPPAYEEHNQPPVEPQPQPDPDTPQPINQFPPRLPAAVPRAPAPPPLPSAPRQILLPPLNLPRGLQLGPDNPVLVAVIPPEYLPFILICHVIENNLFHRQIGNIYLRDLRPSTSFYEIKYMLVQEGLGIERMNIRIRVDDGEVQ